MPDRARASPPLRDGAQRQDPQQPADDAAGVVHARLHHTAARIIMQTFARALRAGVIKDERRLHTAASERPADGIRRTGRERSGAESARAGAAGRPQRRRRRRILLPCVAQHGSVDGRRVGQQVCQGHQGLGMWCARVLPSQRHRRRHVAGSGGSGGYGRSRGVTAVARSVGAPLLRSAAAGGGASGQRSRGAVQRPRSSAHTAAGCEAAGQPSPRRSREPQRLQAHAHTAGRATKGREEEEK